MISLDQKGSQQAVFVSSIPLWQALLYLPCFLGFVTALWGFKLYAVVFQVFFCDVHTVHTNNIHSAKPLYRRRHLPGVLNILVPVQRQFGWEAAELGPRERLKGSKTLSEIV